MKILIPSIKSKQKALKACTFLMTFTVSKPYPPFVLSEKEYLDSCNAELINHISYYKPRKDQYCIVMDDRAFKYDTDMDKMRLAFSDFSHGWNACRGK